MFDCIYVYMELSLRLNLEVVDNEFLNLFVNNLIKK